MLLYLRQASWVLRRPGWVARKAGVRGAISDAARNSLAGGSAARLLQLKFLILGAP
jgi:hypothetical protein